MSSFEERRAIYLSSNSDEMNTYALLLQAYSKEKLNTVLIDKCINDYNVNKTAKKDNDFNLIMMMRLLYLSSLNNIPETNTLYSLMNTALKDQKFWLTKNEQDECFWSENHMICYLSAWFLWNQYSNQTDKQCNELIITYLTVKNKYLFYECFSQVYNMYTLNALLNLYDFSKNTQIKDLAKSCIDIIIEQFLQIITLNGSIYCASGRTYNRCKISSDGHNCNKLMYLLTGLNNDKTLSPAGAFFSTTSYNPNQDYTRYHSKFDKTIKISHDEIMFDSLYKNLSFVDKTMFQWSAGNYFNSENIADTVKLMDNYNLWSHKHFKLDPYATILQIVPKDVLTYSSNTVDAFTGGSPLCDIIYHIYNNNYFTLTSMENYKKGKLGAQQLPWIANVGGISVFTQSGKISTIGDLHEVIGNSHLPFVKQNKNVAMVMYNPDDLIRFSKSKANLDLSVYLNWSGFDNEERMVNKHWFFGEKITNNTSVFIAVYSTDGITDSADKTISNASALQGWAIIVSDSFEYKDFRTFKESVLKQMKISFKKIKSKNTISKILSLDSYYCGELKFNDIIMEMKWKL